MGLLLLFIFYSVMVLPVVSSCGLSQNHSSPGLLVSNYAWSWGGSEDNNSMNILTTRVSRLLKQVSAVVTNAPHFLPTSKPFKQYKVGSFYSHGSDICFLSLINSISILRFRNDLCAV